MKFTYTLLLLIFAGCATNAAKMRPDKPESMKTESPTAISANPMFPYTLSQFDKDCGAYKDALGKAVDAAALLPPEQRTKERLIEVFHAATVRRDIIINRIRADIHTNSGEFEEMLRQNMAKWETGADLAELSLSAATTIVGGEQSKTVLGAILTAVKGAHTSIDKNFFMEQSSKAIIATLRASRDNHDLVMIAKMKDNRADQYTLEEAWTDLIDLYYAGTLASAFQELTEQSGKKATDAKKDLQTLNMKRSPTLSQILIETPPTTHYIDLAKKIGLAIGARKKDDAQLRDVATRLGITVAENQDVREVLKEEVFRNMNDNDKMDEYERVFNAVFGKKENW